MSLDEGPVGARLRAARRRAGTKARDSRTTTDVKREKAKLDQKRRDYPTARPLPNKRPDFSHGRPSTSGPSSPAAFTQLVRNALDESKAIVTGMPKAAVKASKDFYSGSRDSRYGALGGLNKAFVEPQTAYVKEKYGPLLPGGRPASDTLRAIYNEPVSSALDIAGVTSLVGGTVARSAGAASRAGTPLRTLSHGKAEVKPRTSPSFLTRAAENRYDRFSERLAERGIGGPMSARSRVAKQGAKDIKQESVRARASGAADARKVAKIGGRPETFKVVRSRPERTAFFWEAQLPDSLKGGKGLQMLADDARRMAKETTDPQAASRLEKQARMIERAKGKKYDPGALDAMKTLNREVERIYLASGKLNPDVIEPRQGLLGRQLGVEDTAGAEYVQHTTQPPKKVLGRNPGMVRNSGGETRAPANLHHENQLRLYAQGRLRVDPDVIVENWQRAQHYEYLNMSKDFLAAMGEPIGPVGPNKGWFVVNRNGHKLPRKWKDVDPDDATAAAGFSPDDMLFDDLSEYAANTVARTGTPEAAELLRKSIPEDVVQVHPDAVKHFFNQLVGPQGAAGNLGRVGEVADAAMDLVRFSLIYSNPITYGAANLIGNTAMAATHQGVFLPANIYRAAKELAGDPKHRDMVLAEVGFGPTTGIASGGKNIVSRSVKKVAEIEGRAFDDVLRATAWIHEARKVGYKTKADRNRLLTDKKLRDDLNQVRSQTDNAMADFNRQGPVERATLGRLAFVWTWIRAAAHYPPRLAADRPGRSALMAHAALEANKSTDDLGARPTYMDQAFPVGPEGEDGYRPVMSGASTLTPSTPLETIQTLGSLFSDKPSGRTAADLINPGLRAAFDTLGGRIDYGDRVVRVGGKEAAKTNLGGLASPGVMDFTKDLIDGNKKTRLYRPGRKEYLKRKVGRGAVPYDVNVKEMHSRAAQAGAKTKQQILRDALKNEKANAKKLGLSAIPAEVKEAIRLKAAADHTIEVLKRQQKKRGDTQTPSGKQFKLTAKQRAAAVLAGLRDAANWFDYQGAKAELDSLHDPEEIKSFLTDVREEVYGSILRDWHAEAKAA